MCSWASNESTYLFDRHVANVIRYPPAELLAHDDNAMNEAGRAREKELPISHSSLVKQTMTAFFFHHLLSN